MLPGVSSSENERGLGASGRLPAERPAGGCPPGKVPCPECRGAKTVAAPGVGGGAPLPCPACAGEGCLETGLLTLGYRTPDRFLSSTSEAITLASLVTNLLAVLQRLPGLFQPARRG